ncbi:BppU family phage baseplate upper protein [Enterococcus faecium]|uniref:BppU family phage baseplate upper protein n=1 Tax=Enterococcus faecium TaxID=1352 RepID=UPI003B22217D
MADRKVGEITVPTEPVSRATKITGFTFKSYDKNAGVLQFNIENQDGSPTDLIDATVRLFMHIYQGEEKKEFPIFDNQIITESYMQGIVKYRIPDMLLSYEGKVDANVYIDFPDGSHTDNLAFTFNIEKSVIDDNVQLNGEYYFKDFQQLLDGVKQEATDAVNAALTNVDSTIEKANQQINEFVQGATQAIDQTVDEVTEQLQATQTKIDTVSQNVTSAQNNLKAVEDKMNQTKQQIGDLGKLKKMYSNSIDFGDYDYSGNPNLMSVIKASDFNVQSDVTVSDVGYNSIRITSQGIDQLSIYTKNNISSLLKGKTYTLSATVKFEEGTTGDIGNLMIGYRKASGGTILLYASTEGAEVGKELTIKGTGLVNYEITDLSKFYLSISMKGATKIKGGVIISNIKIEEGTTATPYQPNLLEDPYWLGKIPLGENIADPIKIFPIKTSSYSIYLGKNTEKYQLNQTYTITMKATKPATQQFGVYLLGGAMGVGNMKPVEGLSDVWQLTFKVTQAHLDAGITDVLNLYQFPNTSVGAVTIDWIKLEKGNTRTPNISQFKYFGEGLKDSNNPNDYSWDITPEYTEKGLNDSVSLTEPETVLGLKNFEDGLQIAGKEVAAITDLDKTAITTVNNKDGEIADFNLNGAVFGFGSEIKTTGTKAAFTRNSDKKLVCQIAGTYIFNGQLSVQVQTAIDAWHYVDMRVNGTTAGSPWARGVQSFRNRWNFSGMLQVSLKVGDVIDFVSSSSETGATTGQFISCPLAVFQRIGD